MSPATPGGRITRDDLQQAYAEVVGEGEAVKERALPTVGLVIGAVALAVLTLTYLAGKRRGNRKSAVVEIRRL
jgi:hypothetical protein